ncbi:hypothetical protein QA641_37830 [Bradyrhizobium sp. CB1650]|uniref:hypothetical protein n=1 Tax=Bradyrhizobium sp. CB1650 TaxID=3039153 RepID=UPI0024357FD2|nr:hypothetical protein [Bradyrhizobium sp. CB1650]WGD51194.1 hypothetical protein QA641_37830 [Bradyrhizobium sp. CB1650]
MSDQDVRNPNFIEVVRRNQEYPERYGPYLGAVVHLLTIRAARQKSPPWWTAVIAIVGAIGGLVWKYGVPGLF